MKRKTNVSVQDNRGIHITSYMHVGEEYHGYIPGDILDANTVVKLIHDAIAGMSIEGSDFASIITSEQIQDKTIKMEDLSDDVADKINSGGASYNASNETMEIGGSSNINNQ